MNGFRMCTRCSAEYNDILDRRFHAQPIACNDCGPRYLLRSTSGEISDFDKILEEIAGQIVAGKTVALKGTGGYFLVCDALQNEAITRLRDKKHRDQKPFAVMFRDIASVKEFCNADRNELKELTSWRRPVVILRLKKVLAESVSNGLRTTGAILPYMPVQYLLFRLLKTPAIVMTSGNISGEPIITGDAEASVKLGSVADSIVGYNREILNRVDDSVVRVINGGISLIRRSRGFVPRPVDLALDAEGILAMGAEEKNSFCIGKGRQAIMSQYTGDLKDRETTCFYKESIGRFSELFSFSPAFIAADLHPDYYSTVYGKELAERMKIPFTGVQHHHAHIASCMAENGLDEKVIGISLDGTGFGTDGRIWGGEFLIADFEDYFRYTHFDYVPMPGGEKAVTEPWRMAFSYMFKYFGDTIDYNKIPAFKSHNPGSLPLLKEMIIKNINSPESSGAGRLFDAVSALAGLCTISHFDSEAPMRLESSIGSGIESYYPYTFGKTIIFADTLKGIIADLYDKEIPLISAKFHNTVGRVVLEAAERIRNEAGLNKVVLSGGVFQNKYLLEKSFGLLTKSKFEVFTNRLVPANDGGISLGQLVVASKKAKYVSEHSGKNNIN